METLATVLLVAGMPGLIHLLIVLLVLAAACGIVWWAFTQIPLPQPARIIGAVVVAIVALIVLLYMVGGGLPGF